MIALVYSKTSLLLFFTGIFLKNNCVSFSYQRPSSVNCTWKYVEQPFSHFERNNIGNFKQRLCVYDKFWVENKSLPVFIYTGNESPVEEYVNNTGLVWNLAEKFSALIVFAEHRYFGESIPNITGLRSCVAYLNSEEALADYASLVNRIKNDWGAKDSAIIAFGGSYGGMLAAWMRIQYPSAIDGGTVIDSFSNT